MRGPEQDRKRGYWRWDHRKVSSREKRKRRWDAIRDNLLDDLSTGYIEIYRKDGNPLHAKHVHRELIDLNFEQERSKQDTGSQ